eukprot:365192-Chlamydomonas_euryale.AAC.30
MNCAALQSGFSHVTGILFTKGLHTSLLPAGLYFCGCYTLAHIRFYLGTRSKPSSSRQGLAMPMRNPTETERIVVHLGLWQSVVGSGPFLAPGTLYFTIVAGRLKVQLQ